MISLLRRLRITQGKYLYFLLIALLLPMHFLPTFRRGVTWFHLVNVVLLAGYLLAFLQQGRRLRWYFLLPLWIYLIGSVIGMFNSTALGLNVYTIAQDIYIYVWFVVLCVLIASQDDIDYLTAAWLFGVLLVLVLGYTSPSGTGIVREEFTFRNPNRAASYFMTSSALLFAPVFARRRWLRVVMIPVLLFATYSTGSVATFGSFAVAAAVMLSVLLYMRTGGFWAFRQAILLLFIAAIVYTTVAYSNVEGILAQRLPASIGRTPRSFVVRQQIWQEGLKQFRQHPFGIGPASFFAQVDLSFGPPSGKGGGIELHSDYIAALVERGVIGLAGFLLLMGFVIVLLLRLVRTARVRGSPEVRLWVAALCGAINAYFVYALTHEALHHDTLWLLFALAVAQLQILERAPVAARTPVPVSASLRLRPARASGTP